jgi:hypothetical protein
MCDPGNVALARIARCERAARSRGWTIAASTTAGESVLAKPSAWSDKVIAVLRAGNADAAIAQIKVAPGVGELRALEKALAAAHLAGRWRNVDAAIRDTIHALSSPRLHRSP